MRHRTATMMSPSPTPALLGRRPPLPPGYDADPRVSAAEVVGPHQAAGQGHVLPAQADIAPPHPAVPDQQGGHVLGGVDGNCKTETLGGHNHRGVDADDFAGGGDQGASGIPGIEGRIGLDDIINETAGPGPDGTPQGADHSGGDRT